MKNFLLFIVFFLPLTGRAQSYASYNFKKIDKWASADIPKEKAYNVKSLSEYLSVKAENDVEKARAFYVWIANHIDYADSLLNYDWMAMAEHVNNQSADVVFQRRIAICLGFSNLFQAMCEFADVKSEVVTGLCKNLDNEIADMGHAWNAVFLNGKWELVDPTWGAVELDHKNRKIRNAFREKYFLTPAKTFLEDHFPFDPIWQLLDFPFNKKEFAAGTVKTRDKGAVYPASINFNDSIRVYLTGKQAPGQQIANVASFNRTLLADSDSEYANMELGTYHVKEAVLSLYHIDHSLSNAEVENILDLNLEIKNLDPAVRDHLFTAKGYFDKIPRNEMTENAIDLFADAFKRLTFVYYTKLCEIQTDALSNNINSLVQTPKKWNEISSKLQWINSVLDSAAQSIDNENLESVLMIDEARKVLGFINLFYLSKRISKYIPGWEDGKEMETSAAQIKTMDSLLLHMSEIEIGHQKSELFHQLYSSREGFDKSQLLLYINGCLYFKTYFTESQFILDLQRKYGDLDDAPEEDLMKDLEKSYRQVKSVIDSMAQPFIDIGGEELKISVLKMRIAYAGEFAGKIREVVVDKYNQSYNNLNSKDKALILKGLKLAEQYFVESKSYYDILQPILAATGVQEIQAPATEDEDSEEEYEYSSDDFNGTLESLRELIKEVEHLKVKN